MNWAKIINSSRIIGWIITAIIIFDCYAFWQTGDNYYRVEMLILLLSEIALSAVEFLAKLLLMNGELLIKIYNQKEIE